VCLGHLKLIIAFPAGEAAYLDFHAFLIEL